MPRKCSLYVDLLTYVVLHLRRLHAAANATFVALKWEQHVDDLLTRLTDDSSLLGRALRDAELTLTADLPDSGFVVPTAAAMRATLPDREDDDSWVRLVYAALYKANLAVLVVEARRLHLDRAQGWAAVARLNRHFAVPLFARSMRRPDIPDDPRHTSTCRRAFEATMAIRELEVERRASTDEPRDALVDKVFLLRGAIRPWSGPDGFPDDMLERARRRMDELRARPADRAEPILRILEWAVERHAELDDAVRCCGGAEKLPHAIQLAAAGPMDAFLAM
jgi:hypothetical protein